VSFGRFQGGPPECYAEYHFKNPPIALIDPTGSAKQIPHFYLLLQPENRSTKFIRNVNHGGHTKARTVDANSNTGVVTSNVTQGMNACLRLFCIEYLFFRPSM
jgi:hypothetical protein